MYSSSEPQRAAGDAVAASELARRKPSRISATLPWHLVHRLEQRAAYEGRSLSNLIAHLLEGRGSPPWLTAATPSAKTWALSAV